MWIIYAIISALCLGFYDIAKKRSLEGNAVLYVLTCSVWVSSALLLPWALASYLWPETMMKTMIFVPHMDLHAHLLIFLKSCIVLSSWIFAYYSMKHLPITLVTPINATRPMWTLLGAVVIFGESLNGWQWAGVTVALLSFYAFSLVGKTEGISWKHNVWHYTLLLATLLGACSGLYDKHLMRHLDHNAVQVWYTVYQAVMMLLLLGAQTLLHRVDTTRQREGRKPLMPRHSTAVARWKWAIVGISVFLVASDFIYLLALTDPDSLISVVSTVRRGGCIIPFVYGAVCLGDKNIRMKSVCLAGVITGMIFLLIGTL